MVGPPAQRRRAYYLRSLAPASSVFAVTRTIVWACPAFDSVLIPCPPASRYVATDDVCDCRLHRQFVTVA